MEATENLDLDQLRRDFAQRISELIGDEKNKKNLEKFSTLTGVSMRQLSQWQNKRQINWPSTISVIQMCWRAGISPTWLLFGYAPQSLDPKAQKLKTVSLAGGITDEVLHKKIGGAEQKRKTGSKE